MLAKIMYCVGGDLACVVCNKPTVQLTAVHAEETDALAWFSGCETVLTPVCGKCASVDSRLLVNRAHEAIASGAELQPASMGEAF